jgi:phenol 2-monooxygenase
VFAADPASDIFEMRSVDRDGVLIVVRPDQYVSNVLPLTATTELAEFFKPLLLGDRLASRAA